MIFKLDMIQKFESDFKQELNLDKKYLPIYDKLVVLLHDINPTIEYTEKKLAYQQQIALDVNLQIHKKYAYEVELKNSALRTFIEEHKTIIDQFQKEKIIKLQAINKEQKTILKDFELKKQKIKDIYEEKQKQIEQNLKRELSQFDKEKLFARKLNQEQTQEIESEQKATLLNLEKTYASSIHEVNTDLEKFELDKQKELEENEAHFVNIKLENDKIYLDIRNNYHQLTKEFNISINKLKKTHEKAKKTLETKYHSQIKPVTDRLEQLNNDYQSSIDKAKKAYQMQLLELDDLFNTQKEEYETKKEKIIHLSNESITLLNSKLSAYRESINQEKIDQSRNFRDNIKHTDDPRLKDKINRDLTRTLNAIDNDLNKQILRTHKDIIIKQKLLQQSLYDHDIKHLKQMNDWRLKRNLLSYDYKQDLAKIDLNYNHNLSLSKKHIDLIDATYKHQLYLIEMTLRNNLLPLESQLTIQSMVQERELNLLNNDQHIATYTSKLNVARISHKYQLMIEKAKLKEYISKLDYDSETQVVQITTQLELEKTKSKRDFTIEEQDIRANIAKAIFDKNKQHNYKVYLSDIDQIEQQEYRNDIEKKYSIDQIKLDEHLRFHEQEFLLLETKSIHQANQSHEKALRLMKLYLNELTLNQNQVELLFDVLRLYYQKHLDLKQLIKALYLLPSHPEVFKHVLKKCNSLLEAFQLAIKETIIYFKSLDLTYYQKKIEDMTGYKYMIKHEDIMNLYEQEIQKVEAQKSLIQNEISQLEQQFFINQQNLEKQELFILQLKKVSENIQSGKIKSKLKHQDLKDNQKLISNHEKDIKVIKHRLTRIEKAIDQKHINLQPFDTQIELVQNNMKKEQLILEKHKLKESDFYQDYANSNQKIYDSLLSVFSQFTDSHIHFIKNLEDTVYVTDSLLYTEEKRLNKDHMLFGQKIFKHQQFFLTHIRDFYEANDQKQEEIVRDFNKAQSHLTRELAENKASVLNDIKKQQISLITQQEKDIKSQVETHKNDLKLKENADKKDLLVITNHIKSLENNLEFYLDKMKQELNLINDNQIQVASQSLQEYEKQHMILNHNNYKQVSKYDQQLEAEEKSFQTLDTSISNKNQALLIRFEQNRTKQIALFEEKTKQFESNIEKSRETNKNEIKIYDHDVTLMQETRSYEIRNMKEHTKRFTTKSEKSQQKVYKNELKSLRLNYRFKLKALKLK
ncbi:hypothetical protein [Mariniplasma anaerobium]|uniref:Uncharacterized protein n=1 Tax=Mariniplasma anaerobium TaxID=2735436 RepID=A0A7R7V7U2_9MOLU|nr:hypothetical protein [Mariniplasma anaerobium]BCR36050.1 hypothetical protein MPAN_009430 [Mariniplasma anaerobium]